LPHYTAVLVGFQEQGNLGVGYLASTLAQRGYAVRVVDFRERRESVLGIMRDAQPAVVGFSVIFQYYVPQFRELASYLRRNGVKGHFCAGGHFPSLRYEYILRQVPELDSVVRFEGEITLAELVQCLIQGRDWHGVAGIAFRDGDRCVATQPRPLIADLDQIPFPERPFESGLTVLGRKASPLMASRGCSRACSFCSIRQFYGQVPGRKVRIRKPGRVVEEMRALHHDHGVSIFLFQDDDFPVWGDFGRRWVGEFIQALRAAGMGREVLWKISCRCDEVEPELFTRMRDAGLYVVYLGIESGNPAGLRMLHKRLTVEDNLRAVGILQDLEIAFTYGFMLFDPSSTFTTLRQNVAFLKRITAASTVPVVFCRMLPYAATPIEHFLATEGRLRGTVANPDYDFTDPRLNAYFTCLNERVSACIQGSDSLANQLNFAWQEYWVMRRLSLRVSGLPDYERSLRSVTSGYNDFILSTVEDGAREFESGGDSLPPLAEFHEARRRFSSQLVELRDPFVLRNQGVLMASLNVSE